MLSAPDPTRHLCDVDQPRTSPTGREQPRTRPRNRGRIRRASDACRHLRGARPARPPIEPAPRRRRIDPRDHPRKRNATLRRMPSRIQEHIRNRPPHLPQRSQHVQVEPIPQHHPTPPEPEHALYRPNDPHRHRLHPTSEIERARRLDDQMQMIPLHGPVHDAEAPALAAVAQRRGERADEAGGAQRRQAAAQLQRDVTRRRPTQSRPTPVRIAADETGFAACAGAAAAPTRSGAEVEGKLRVAARHQA